MFIHGSRLLGVAVGYPCNILKETGCTTVPLKAGTNLQCRLIQACTSADVCGHCAVSLTVTSVIVPRLAVIAAFSVTTFAPAWLACSSPQAVRDRFGGGAKERSGLAARRGMVDSPNKNRAETRGTN